MTLRNKTLIIVTLTIVALIGILYAISSNILMGGFDDLENEDATRNTQRAVAALENEIAVLDTTLHDWACWDDTYEFVADLNEGYIQSNLLDETFILIPLNLVMVFNADGQQVYTKAFDLESEKEVPVPASIEEHLSPDGVIVQLANHDTSVSGLLIVDNKPLMIAAHTVMNSAEEGPIRGTMIMARFLDSHKIEKLAGLTQLSLALHKYEDEALPADFASARAGLSPESPEFVQTLDNNMVAGYSLVGDIYGNPALILEATMPRSIHEQGLASNNYLIAALAITGLAFLGLTVLLLEKLVLSRVSRLSKSVRAIGEGGDITERLEVTGNDELANLGTGINGMLESLEEAGRERRMMEQQLLLAGRLAAVGELAAGVAHELNNPLTAVQGYAQLLTEKAELPEEISADVQIIYREAKRASKITHNLLAFAREHTPKWDSISINDAIKDILELYAYHLIANNIEINTELTTNLPRTMADFNQIQQVFVNLLINAEQAMTDANGKGVLTIRTEQVNGYICTTFSDDGPGIAAEDIDRLFDPFFTTKEVGKGTGLGLSICYGIVNEHGGRIYARRKPSSGATFVVELPCLPEQQVTGPDDN